MCAAWRTLRCMSAQVAGRHGWASVGIGIVAENTAKSSQCCRTDCEGSKMHPNTFKNIGRGQVDDSRISTIFYLADKAKGPLHTLQSISTEYSTEVPPSPVIEPPSSCNRLIFAPIVWHDKKWDINRARSLNSAPDDRGEPLTHEASLAAFYYVFRS